MFTRRVKQQLILSGQSIFKPSTDIQGHYQTCEHLCVGIRVHVNRAKSVVILLWWCVNSMATISPFNTAFVWGQKHTLSIDSVCSTYPVPRAFFLASSSGTSQSEVEGGVFCWTASDLE